MKHFYTFLLIMLVSYSNVVGQIFHKIERKDSSGNNQNKKIWKKYEHSEFEDYQAIICTKTTLFNLRLKELHLNVLALVNGI